MEDLEAEITLHYEALALRPQGHPDRPSALDDLASVLFTRFQKLGRMEDLEEAIMCPREALALCPRGHPNRSAYLNNLGLVVFARFQQLGRMEDLEESINYHHEALALRPHGHPNRSSSLSNLGVAISTRFQQLGRTEDLEEAVLCHCEALSLCPRGHPNHSACLDHLGLVVFTRFQQLGRTEDLEGSINCYHEALALRPHGHPNRSSSLSNLGVAISTRFQQLGRMEDLEEAIICQCEALALCPRGHPNRSSYLNNLGLVVSTRFEQLGRMEDLEQSIKCHREALALRPHGHPNRSSSLSNLGVDMSTRFQQLGRTEDLEEAIICRREALALCPRGHPNHSTYLANLGFVMSTRFKQLGRMEDLEESINCHHEALALRPHGHPDHSSSLNNLGTVVFTRFEQLGRMEDLEQSINCHHEALALCPHGHPKRSNSLNDLGLVVFARFEQLGRMGDLEQSINYNHEALALRPHGHPSRSSSLNNLGLVVFIRFQQLGRMEDLDEAITCNREALALISPGHHHRSGFLSNLGNVMSDYFKKSGKIEDLEEAITCYHEALVLRPHGHPDRPFSLSNLGDAMFDQFEQSGQKNDLLDAVKYVSEAKVMLPTEHPAHTKVGSKLASLLLKLYDIVPKSDESLHILVKAFDLFEHAANHSFASARARFDIAVQWAREAHHRKHQSTVHAYAKSLTLLDRCLIISPTIEWQQSFLAVVSKTLALDAASSAIDQGELRSAVELLEQGRAILWSKLRGYRHPLDKLRAIDKELVDQLKTLSSQLEHRTVSFESWLKAQPQSTGERPVMSVEVMMRQYRILSEKWDDVVGKIRQIDGFTDFLQAVPFATLQTAAVEGPVIIVNISNYRSDAIILRDAGDPVLVPLPASLPTDLDQLSSQFAQACSSHGTESARQILPVLRSLWYNIALPVRDQLVTLGVSEKSRIWWCPTSSLCALPLHAAGTYSRKNLKLEPNNLLDCYISSYTPTLSALIKARSGIVPRSTDPHLLVIAQPDENLPAVKQEVNRIQQLVNDVDVLEGPEATQNTVLSGLQTHSWAHFACHGHLNDQPFHSSFQLHGGSRLALADVIRAQLPDADLAFLSACHTAVGDTVGTPDEVIHLAAAMQFCGFRSVVGTLWAMEDVDGPAVTEDFYQYMLRTPGAIPNFRDSAQALHDAIRKMRGRRLGLDRWVKFVHIGA